MYILTIAGCDYDYMYSSLTNFVYFNMFDQSELMDTYRQ